MANFIGKIKNMFAVDEYDDDFDDEIDDEEVEIPKVNIPRTSNVTSFDQYSSERYSPRKSSVGQMPASSRFINTNVQVEVVIASPTNLEEAGAICADLRAKKATVVNLENVEYEAAQRISDFLSGAAYALEGKIQLISDMIFIIGPVNVDITGEFRDELRASGIKLPTGVWK